LPAFVLYLILSCLTCLVMINIPSLMFVLAIIWGIILILTGLETNKKQLTIIYAANLLLLWFLAGTIDFLYIGLPALAMAFRAINKNSGYYNLLKVGLGTAVIAGGLLLGLIYLNGDNGITQVEHQINNYVKENLELYENSGAFELYRDTGMSEAEFESSLYKIVHVMVQHMPALYFLQTIMITAITLYLASRLARRRGLNRLEKRPFAGEQLPWQFAWVVIAGLGLWLTGQEESTMRLIGSNLLAVMAPVLAYFGLSVLAFKLNNVHPFRKPWLTVLIVITAIFLTLPVLIFLILLGLFDSLIDYRKLRTDKEVPL